MRKSHLELHYEVSGLRIILERDSYRHPAFPWTPRILSAPEAKKLPKILHASADIQNKARRKGNSVFV